MNNEDLSKWKPVWRTDYKGYGNRNKDGLSGKVIIHMGNEEHEGGFYIHRTGSVKIWYKDRGVYNKYIYVPVQLCKFAKHRGGSWNIYDVFVYDAKIGDEGVTMIQEGGKPMSQKESAGFWARVFRTKDLKEWVEIFQDELDTRWRTFDGSLNSLTKEWTAFKKINMEIAEAEENAGACRKEWSESLDSLGNILEKVKKHEWEMWNTTQKSRHIRVQKNAPKIKYSDVDEMNFNSMTDFIKQYPDLQAQRTVDKAIESIKDKRAEVLAAEKVYNEKIKEANVYLNTANSRLQAIDYQLTSFETIKFEGFKKIEGELKKPINKIRIKMWWTPKEQQRLQLYLYESDRKIDESRNQLKLMKEDLKDYEKRAFKPIVTKKFTAIED